MVMEHQAHITVIHTPGTVKQGFASPERLPSEVNEGWDMGGSPVIAVCDTRRGP